MSDVTKLWFVKARRAQNQDDDETWKQGGVCTTLNAFDNGGESRATVLVLQSTQPNAAIDDDLSPTLVQAMGKGGGHVPILIIDGTRVDDVRVTDDEIMQTVIQRWGTGGGNVPAIAYSIREDATANNFSATEIEQARALQALQPSVQSHHAQTFIAEPLQVRRLTPMECERLQGFPDGWTASQSDSQRYRQMGNAVTVNVIESIGQQLGRVSNG
jgi:DNA (cytosine-5)-methyltransferase 1